MANTLLDEWIFETAVSKNFVMLAGSSIQKLRRIGIMGPNLTRNVLSYRESKAVLLVWLLDFDVFSG